MSKDSWFGYLREKCREVGREVLGSAENFHTATWIFLRALAVISFIAFLSLHVQISGLIGEQGIMPAQDYLNSIEENTGTERYLRFPTLAWLGSNNEALKTLTVSGMLLSILLFFNLAPALILLLIWMLYLSLVTVGQVFMSYQWDMLLLETLFLSVFLAPKHLYPANPGEEEAPTRLSLLVMWFLLFKLVFLSGITKLLSGDPTWWSLTALDYHYLTQPLPTPLAWFMDKLPLLFHQISALLMFAVELAVPILFFAPRKFRIGGAYASIGLQVLIMLTGNYTFFNLLAIGLSLLLLDNEHLSELREMLESWIPEVGGTSGVWSKITAVILTVVMVLNLAVIVQFLGIGLPGQVEEVKERVSRFRTVNSYGLFAVMTKERPEIIVQGSRNREEWRTYRFRYKPDSPGDIPPVVAPHQPRLDWQMWFAAYSSPRRSRWFMMFVRKLLQGSEPVEGLLERNPFPDRPPKYIRAVRYSYRFSGTSSLTEGRWWEAERKGLYLPPVQLRNNG